MYYFLLILAVLGIVAMFAVSKIYQKQVPANLYWALIKNIVLTAVAMLIYWIFLVGGKMPEFTPLSLWCALAMSVVAILSTIVAFFGYCKGNIGIFSVFQMAGGMLIPYVYGAATSNPISVWNVIGLLLILCGLSLSVFVQIREIRQSATRISPAFLLLCVAIFFLNGGISLISYVYCNHPSMPSINPFMIAKCFFGILITLPLIPVALCLQKKEANRRETVKIADAVPTVKPRRVSYLAIVFGLLIAIALIDATSYFLQITATPHLPAVVIYPFVTGGTVALTAIVGRIFFKEKMDRLSTVGVIITALATLLFLF